MPATSAGTPDAEIPGTDNSCPATPTEIPCAETPGTETPGPVMPAESRFAYPLPPPSGLATPALSVSRCHYFEKDVCFSCYSSAAYVRM